MFRVSGSGGKSGGVKALGRFSLRSIRTQSILLILLMLVVTSTIAGLLLADSARLHRESTERQLQSTARAMSSAVDGELAKYEALLGTLARSDAMRAGDFEALDRLARQSLPGPQTWIVVLDETGKQRMNTLLPYGSKYPGPLPAVFAERRARLLTEGRVVSDLSRSSVDPDYALSVRILAPAYDSHRYELGLVFRPDVLNRLLVGQSLPKGWYAGVLDRRGLMIARNVDAARFVGAPANATAFKQIQNHTEGVFEAASLDGADTVFAFTRSRVAGWTVSVGMPRSEATGYLSRSLLQLLAASAALLIIGLIVSYLALRRTAQAVETVVQSAGQLAQSGPGVEPVRTGFDETDQIAAAMHEAAVQLAAREHELRCLNETLEQRVADTAERLVQAQKIDTLGQLTGGVAHDFNNLLSPIIGGLDRLQRGGLSEERAGRAIGGALEAAERAKTLVQRLLAFARRQPLQPSAVDIAAVVSAVTELIGSTLGPRVEVSIEVATGLPPAKADPNQLELALLNLAVNARDAMPDGGLLKLAAWLDHVDDEPHDGLVAGDYIRISITDTGAGMDEDILKRAVEPFFSTKGIGRGTGLGLSMVHGLAAQLGGALRLTSVVGEGTTVDLWLPLARDLGEAAPAAAPTSAPLKPGVVLLVEDEPLVRASTAAMLVDLGFTVIECGSAEEGLGLLERRSVDLVITDHLMPGMDGAALARLLLRRDPPVRTLIISGYADVEAIAPDLPRLIKPFRQADLGRAIAGLA